MKKFLLTILVIVTMSLVAIGVAQAVTLEFNVNDIFNYATTDDTRLNQQGTARFIQSNGVTGRDYRTYNDATRDSGATATQDLNSIANILNWNAFAGFQGVSHIQFWLSDGINVRNWGEKVVQQDNTSLLPYTDEYDWTAYTGVNTWDTNKSIAHYNTVLGGAGHQNAISLDFNPADNLWSVTGDFYVDENGNGVWDSGDSDLVIGNDYTIWFSASFNNWRCIDGYGNDAWGSFDMQGTIVASAVPEPATMFLLGSGLIGFAASRKKFFKS